MRLAPPLHLGLYLAKRYFFWFALTLAALVSFVLLIDSVELYRRFSNIATDESALFVFLILLFGIPEKIDLLISFAVIFGSLLCFQHWSKTNELIAARSFGQTIWQALMPVFLTVLAIGFFQILILNPIKAATSSAQTEMKISLFGATNANRMSVSTSGIWLKDSTSTDNLIIHGPSLALSTYQINEPIIYGLQSDGSVIWRITAQSIALQADGWLIADGQKSERDGTITPLEMMTLPTSITPADFIRTTQEPETISIYALPAFITMLDVTGLPANEHRVYFQQLLSIPLQLLALCTLAVCFTLLRFTRMPRYKLIATGLAAGFAIYFVTDLIYLLGANARLPIFIAGWGPAITLLLISGYFIARSEDV